VMDGLVEMARGTALRLECRGGALWGQVAGGSPIEIPLRRPIFRAGLSRIAVRCESARGTSVSPYGGAGQIVLGGDAPARVRVTFVNTPDQQMLELIDERVLDRVFSPAESSTNGSTQPSTEPSRTRD
jgi:hypothetical protein